jgi:hypothetical protein
VPATPSDIHSLTHHITTVDDRDSTTPSDIHPLTPASQAPTLRLPLARPLTDRVPMRNTFPPGHRVDIGWMLVDHHRDRESATPSDIHPLTHRALSLPSLTIDVADAPCVTDTVSVPVGAKVAPVCQSSGRRSSTFFRLSRAMSGGPLVIDRGARGITRQPPVTHSLPRATGDQTIDRPSPNAEHFSPWSSR